MTRKSPPRPPREITPRDLPLMEPDLLGVVSMVLHGRASPPAEEPPPSDPEVGKPAPES